MAAVDTGQESHAYLFLGPRHVGKGHLANHLAQTLLCEKASASGACDSCTSCQSFKKQLHPDLILLGRQPEEHTISIEQTRVFLSRLRQSPAMSNRKIAIVDEAEFMTTAAANAFLKQLEEPTESTTLILLVHNRAKLLPTILSRCQVLEFDRVQKQPADANSTIWQQSGGLPGLYLTYTQSPSLAQLEQDEAQGIFNLFDMTAGQRLAYLDSFFSKKKTTHAQQKQVWDQCLRAWQRALRQAAVQHTFSSSKTISYKTFLNVSDEIDNLRRGLDKNINIRSHLERFCLHLDPP